MTPEQKNEKRVKGNVIALIDVLRKERKIDRDMKTTLELMQEVIKEGRELDIEVGSFGGVIGVKDKGGDGQFGLGLVKTTKKDQRLLISNKLEKLPAKGVEFNGHNPKKVAREIVADLMAAAGVIQGKGIDHASGRANANLKKIDKNLFNLSLLNSPSVSLRDAVCPESV